jgi:hypothetical protein
MWPIFNTESVGVLAGLYAWLQHVDVLLPVQREEKRGPTLRYKKASVAQRFMEVKGFKCFQKETDTKSNKIQGIGKTYREIIYVIK